MKYLLIAFCLLLLPTAGQAEYRLPVGEYAVYGIHWGMINCGTSTISCEEVEIGDSSLIRIRVRVKSNWLVSTVYPVDNTVDCYIDPETRQSVRLIKHTSEGDVICRDILEINRNDNIASWTSHSDNIATNYPIDADSCDAVSFLYAFRNAVFTENISIDYRIVVDAALHGITVTAGEQKKKPFAKEGRIPCRKYEVSPWRDDLFVRKIPEAIWLTDDERKIMVRMDVKIPVGKVRIVLEEYTAPPIRI